MRNPLDSRLKEDVREGRSSIEQEESLIFAPSLTYAVSKLGEGGGGGVAKMSAWCFNGWMRGMQRTDGGLRSNTDVDASDLCPSW